jgi:hypothetical protein
MRQLFFLFMAASLLLTGCGTKESRMQDFVNEYNSAAPSIIAGNPSIVETSATVKANNRIGLVFKYDLPFDESYKTAYSQIAPSLLANVFKGQRKLQQLLDDGVIFDVAMNAADGQALAQLELDKARVDAMMKRQDSASGPISITTGGGEEQLRSMLAVMNQSLPVEDKAAGTTITRIDVNPARELVYTVVVNTALENAIRSEAAKGAMRDNILRNNAGIRMVFNSMRKYRITAVRYTYVDDSGKPVNDILIRPGDVR